MKLFLKILFFIFTMIIIMVGEVKSSTVVTVLQEETSYSFFQKPQLGDILFENHDANSCLKEGKVLAYSKQVERTNTVVAKGGGTIVSKLTEKASRARRSVFRYVVLEASVSLAIK